MALKYLLIRSELELKIFTSVFNLEFYGNLPNNFNCHFFRLADLSLDPFSKSSDVGDGATGYTFFQKFLFQN